MKSDLIILWPKSVDYPFFRMRLIRLRQYFNKVIIALTTTNIEPSLEEFIRKVIPDVTFTTQIENPDWVTAAMLPAIEVSESEYITVMHQDFFIKNLENFFSKVNSCEADLVGFDYGQYSQYGYPLIHPIFWRVKVSSLKQTSMDFSAKGEAGMDSFVSIAKELHNQNKKIIGLSALGLVDNNDFFHIQGITEGFTWGADPTHQFHDPQRFYIYCKLNILTPVEQHPFVKKRFKAIISRIEKEMYVKWSNT